MWFFVLVVVSISSLLSTVFAQNQNGGGGVDVKDLPKVFEPREWCVESGLLKYILNEH